MSALQGIADLAPVRRLRRARPPRLRLLADPAVTTATRARAVGRGVFVAVVGALVLAGMAMLLILNTTLAQGAFDLQQLRAEYDALQVQEQSLAQQVERAQSPEALKAQAVRLGMVPVQVPAFLRLADGKVLGEPTPAKARVTRQAKLARGAAVGTGDAASPDTPAATGTTDAATPTGAGDGAAAVAAPQSDSAEAAEDAAARDGRGNRDRHRDDDAVAGPEGAEEQAAPTGTGAGRG